jgi:hypothetical protein
MLGPRVDIGAYEMSNYYLAENINQGRWYVTIQEAIDAAGTDDHVVVSAGTHSGPGNRDLDFRGKAMTLRSGDPADPAVVAATIIQCHGSSDQPHRGLVFRSGEGAGTVVSGLTITGGVAPVESIGATTNAAGGAILCDGANPTISYCRIYANTSTDRGGGLFCNNASPTLRHCQIEYNVAGNNTGAGGTVGAGGGIHAVGSTILMEDCLLTRNRTDRGPSYANPATGTGINAGDGGAAWCDSSSLTFRNCTLSNNSAGPGGYGYKTNNANGGKGGAVYAASGSLAFVNCTLTANNAGFGSSGYYYASKGNGGSGGALYCSGASLSMTGCTMTGNRAGGGGHDVTDERKGRAGNGGDGGAVYCGTATFTDCLIQGNMAGEGGDGEYGGGAGGHGGGIYSPSGTVTLTRCTVIENAAGHGGWGQEPVRDGGGGGGIAASSVVAHRCTIAGNRTGNGGIANTSYSDFASRDAGNGGGIRCGTITIDNSLIVNNLTGYGPRAGTSKSSAGGDGGDGGGIWCVTGTVTNCTFVGNVTGPGGEGYYDNNSPPGDDGLGPSIDGNPTVRNCIFWFNVRDTRLGLAPDPRSMTFDPMLADLYGPDNDMATWQDNDYHLALGSPCINAGENAGAALFSDTTTSNGTTDTVIVADALQYAVGDQVEYAADGQVRVVAQVGAPDGTIRFDPPLPTASQVGKTIRNYGSGDLAGHARLLQGRVDLGAYESQPAFPGDCNGDGSVDTQDLLVLVAAWGTAADEAGYNAAADLNGDWAVDVCDLLMLVADLGKSVQ